MNSQRLTDRIASFVKKRLFFAACFILGLMLISTLVIDWRNALESESSLMVVDSSELDLGDQWGVSGFPFAVELRNRSPNDLRVTGVQRSCNCTTVDFPQDTVPKGGSFHLRGNVNLSAGINLETPFDHREFAFEILVQYQDEAGKAGAILVPLRAKVAAAAVLEIGDLPNRDWRVPFGVADETRRFTVKTHPDVSLVTVSTDSNDVFEFDVKPGDSAGYNVGVQLTPYRRRCTGLFGGQVQLTLHDAKHAIDFVQNAFSINGFIEGPVMVIPGTITLGVVSQDEMPRLPTATVLLADGNLRDEYSVSGVSTDDTSLEVEYLPSETTEGHILGAIRFSVKNFEPRNRVADAILTYRNASGGMFHLTIPVSYSCPTTVSKSEANQ